MSGICLRTVHVKGTAAAVQPISQSQAPLPRLIWLPLQWNEGQRAGGAGAKHMLRGMTSARTQKPPVWYRDESRVRIPHMSTQKRSSDGKRQQKDGENTV